MGEPSANTHALRALIELRKRIMNGSLKGGVRLFEVPLAEDLAISRTPVREAMSRLTEEGLLERAPNGGFLVRSFTFAEVIDAIELRGVLEGTAARLAAERGVSESRLAAVRAVIDRLDECFDTDTNFVNFEAYSDLNAEFHQHLSELSGSAIIQHEIDRATRLPFASPSAFLPDRAVLKTFHRSLVIAQGQHRAIIDSIASREGTGAEFAAREHARGARRNLEYFLATDKNAARNLPGLSLVIE